MIWMDKSTRHIRVKNCLEQLHTIVDSIIFCVISSETAFIILGGKTFKMRNLGGEKNWENQDKLLRSKDIKHVMAAVLLFYQMRQAQYQQLKLSLTE